MSAGPSQGHTLAERLRFALECDKADSRQKMSELYRPRRRRAPGAEPPLALDMARDRMYAHPHHPAFEKVLTIFTQEWVGVRAASGSLPGHKLAIAKDVEMGASQIEELLAILDNLRVETVLVQGLSGGVLRAARALRMALPELQICCVWHGSPAAWCMDEERALARQLLDQTSKGVFDRISIMKVGAHVLHERAVPYMVPNLPPKMPPEAQGGVRKDHRRTALCPSWDNAWKNLHTNIAAALHCDNIDQVFAYADIEETFVSSKKLNRVDYGTRTKHLALVAHVDIVLNATVVDCHPMAELEAIAVGTPILRSPLGLDFGEEHLFSKISTAACPQNVAALIDKINYILSVPPNEMSDIIADYRDLVTQTAFARYERFLGGH